MSPDLPLNQTEAAVPPSWPYPLVGAVATAVCIAGGVGDPVRFFRAYLPAWLFYFGLALGSMAILMIYHLTGGAWGFLIRRILEAGMRTLPLVALGFLPIALGIHYLYPFAQPETVTASAKLQHQTFYLTPNYFWVRAFVYFVLWLIIANRLNAWSRQQDASDDPRLRWKCEQLSAIGAVIYGVTLHFAAIDWTMSLMPAFHSTIWGPLFALGQLLSALALALVVLARLIRHPPLAEVASPKALNDLGSLLLTFLIAWAYMAWFQFMLIWIANLPVDVIYYLSRASNGWLALVWAIVLLHFVVPFFLLLMRPIKRHAGRLATTAALLFVMQCVYMYYQIAPMYAISDYGGLAGHWMDFLMPVGLGGIWLSHFLWQLGGRPLLVEHDPQRAAAAHLRHLDEEETARDEELIP